MKRPTWKIVHALAVVLAFVPCLHAQAQNPTPRPFFNKPTPTPVPLTQIPDASGKENPALPSELTFDERKAFDAQLVSARKFGKADLLILGDQSAGTVNGAADFWKREFAREKRFSVSGSSDQTQNVLWRIEKGILKDLRPKAVLLGVGAANSQDTPEDIARGITAIITAIQTKSATSKVLLLGVLPTGEMPDTPARKRQQAINAQMAKLADDKKVFFVDPARKLLTSTGTLPAEMLVEGRLSPKGTEMLCESLKPTLKKVL